MPYLVIDTETTGLCDFSAPADAPHQPRMASYAFLLVDDDLEIESRIHGLVKPDGWEMPDQAAAINGLTTERLDKEGIPVLYVIDTLRRHIHRGRTLVAHNLQFDAKILRGEYRRLKAHDSDMAMLEEAGRSGICTMKSLQDDCGLFKPNGVARKWPKLSEACRILLMRDLPNAHDALADAKACLWLLRYMAKLGRLKAKEAA